MKADNFQDHIDLIATGYTDEPNRRRFLLGQPLMEFEKVVPEQVDRYLEELAKQDPESHEEALRRIGRAKTED